MSPEGAQAASLIQYLFLILLARVLEFLTGARGILTFVYLGIFATQVLHWLRTGLPAPDEARARVEAALVAEIHADHAGGFTPSLATLRDEAKRKGIRGFWSLHREDLLNLLYPLAETPA